MKLKTRSHPRNLVRNAFQLSFRPKFRSLACSLLAGAGLCAVQGSAFAQSTTGNNLLRGIIATNPSTPAAINGATSSNIDPTTTASIPLADQPVRLNPAQGALPANASNLNDDDTISVRENPNMQPEQVGTGNQNESDPFAPPGFRMGSSIVNTTLEQSIGSSTNASQTTNGNSGYFSQTNLGFVSRSDWSRHELSLNANGTFRKFFKESDADRPTLDLGASLRLDLIDGYTNTLGATYNYATESLTSNRLGTDVATQPGIHTYGATNEFARSDRRLNLSLRGAIERTLYDEATTTGGVLDQADRNNTEYALTARVGYDNGGLYKPFVEVGGGVTRYDEEIDRNGDQRNSTNYQMRAGIELDMNEKLTGEFALGYVVQDYDEGSLASLEGFTVDALLNWSPSRQTMITLNAATNLNGATSAGNNGSINYTGGLVATRQISDRWSVNFNAGYGYDHDQQSDTVDATYTIGTGAKYWMSRYMAISADLDHTIYDSSNNASDYEETVFMLGVLLQR